MGDEAGVRLLVWDDPDLRQGESRVCVGDPAGPGADLGALHGWLAGRCGSGERGEVVVCLVVEPGSEDLAAARVTALRRQGFAVHVHPPVAASSMHAAVATVVETVVATRVPAEVVIASHDATGSQALLSSLAARGVPVTVLCFRELAGTLAVMPGVSLVDPEAVPGLYPHPLPRTNLYDLPPQGRTLPPLQPPAHRPEPAPMIAAAPMEPPPAASAPIVAVPATPTPVTATPVAAVPVAAVPVAAVAPDPVPAAPAPVVPDTVPAVTAAAVEVVPVAPAPPAPVDQAPASTTAAAPVTSDPVRDAADEVGTVPAAPDRSAPTAVVRPPSVPVEPVAPTPRKPIAPWQSVPASPPAGATNGNGALPQNGSDHRLTPPPIT